MAPAVYARRHSLIKMASVEEKAIRAVLNRIRTSRSDVFTSLQDQSPVEGPREAGSPSLREAQFSDFEAVNDLKRRWGIPPDPFDNWQRLWHRNPAIVRVGSALPLGWVLESEGKIVGYLGNIPLLYRYGDKTLAAVAGSGLVVEPSYRVFTMSLMAEFFGQTGVDLYMTTTAIEAVGKIAGTFGSNSLPQAGYGSVLFWVLRQYPFARAVAKKMGLRKPISYIANTFGFLAVGTDGTLRQRRPKAPSSPLPVKEMSIDDISENLQKLWLEKLDEQPRLYADRSAASLRWHFGIPGFKGTVRVLCCYKAGDLVGYAVVRNDEHEGLRRSFVADVLAKRDDADVLRTLFFAAYHHARQAGSDLFEIRDLAPEIRQLCLDGKPYIRTFPACPFHYKAADPTLHRLLAAPAAWYTSPFDGDTTLMP
jgi:hypothetical protein